MKRAIVLESCGAGLFGLLFCWLAFELPLPVVALAAAGFGGAFGGQVVEQLLVWREKRQRDHDADEDRDGGAHG
jgi:hypothetical protein